MSAQPSDDDIVLSDKQLADKSTTSVRTLQRLRKEGKAPPRVRLSDRRYGTRLGDYRKWLAARVQA